MDGSFCQLFVVVFKIDLLPLLLTAGIIIILQVGAVVERANGDIVDRGGDGDAAQIEAVTERPRSDALYTRGKEHFFEIRAAQKRRVRYMSDAVGDPVLAARLFCGVQDQLRFRLVEKDSVYAAEESAAGGDFNALDTAAAIKGQPSKLGKAGGEADRFQSVAAVKSKDAGADHSLRQGERLETGTAEACAVSDSDDAVGDHHAGERIACYKRTVPYAQQVLGMMKVYTEIHPALRDLIYEGFSL